MVRTYNDLMPLSRGKMNALQELSPVIAVIKHNSCMSSCSPSRDVPLQAAGALCGSEMGLEFENSQNRW